jgi:hypothetical protein
MNIARTDTSFCTFYGVHSGLAMNSIYLNGTEEQKQEPLVGSGTGGRAPHHGKQPIFSMRAIGGSHFYARPLQGSSTH